VGEAVVGAEQSNEEAAVERCEWGREMGGGLHWWHPGVAIGRLAHVGRR
jgi:hypothetical protein